MPKPPQNHHRGGLEGPWEPIWAPSEKEVEKKRGKAPNTQSHLEVVFGLLPKTGTPFFQSILGWPPNRLFVVFGTEKPQKRRSKVSLLGAFSGHGDFSKNVLPLVRELNSQGGDPTKNR